MEKRLKLGGAGLSDTTQADKGSVTRTDTVQIVSDEQASQMSKHAAQNECECSHSPIKFGSRQ